MSSNFKVGDIISFYGFLAKITQIEGNKVWITYSIGSKYSGAEGLLYLDEHEENKVHKQTKLEKALR